MNSTTIGNAELPSEATSKHGEASKSEKADPVQEEFRLATIPNEAKILLANIPYEAKISLTLPGGESSSSHSGIHEEMNNSTLIPRTKYLKQIMEVFSIDRETRIESIDPNSQQSSSLKNKKHRQSSLNNERPALLTSIRENNGTSSDQPSPINQRLTLQGMGGLGKSMIAAMAVSRKELRSTFDHILWLNVGNYFKGGSNRNNLSYDMYLECLQILCDQLNVVAKFQRKDFIQPGDIEMIKAMKYLQAIEESKIEMSKIIGGLKILIVLDDIWSHEDVELFNFGEHISSSFCIMLTTRILDLQSPAGSKLICVDLLNREEAHFLFSVEAGIDCQITTEDTEVVDCIVKKYGYLPLAIRTAGRLIRTGRKIQPNTSLQMIFEILLKPNDSPNMAPMIALLDSSFSFITNETASFALKFLFSAFAIVFHRDDILRPWVNLDVVKILWKALLRSSDMSKVKQSLVKYKITRIEDMADIMSLMGILDRKYLRTKNQSKQEIYLRIHHDLMWDFGLFFSSRISMNGGELIKCDQHGIACCDICFADSRDMVLARNTKKWNILIVKQFKSIVGSETNVNLEAYRVNWYPLHIINSGSHYEASAILKCEDFLNSKIQENGIESCVRSMLSFVQSYEKSLNCNPFSDESPMISVIYFIHRYLSNLNASLEGNTIFIKEAAQSLVFLGIELQKFAIWSKSLDLFIEALYLLRSINYDDNHPITAHVLRRIDSCVLRNVVMVARNSPNKLRLKHVGPNISQGHKHLSLELSSHPGFGIVRCEGTRNLTIPGKNISYDFIFLAVGLKDSAIIVNYDGQSIQNESCGRLFYSTLASSGEGVPVIMRSQIQIGSDSQNNEEIKNAINIIHGASLFSIDPDGFIYPTTAPHLCLGIYPHPSVYLVDCESPNRAIFKFTSDLLDSKRVPAKDKCKQFENEVQAHNYEDFDGVKLELSSHPGMGLMAFSDMLDTPLVPGYKYTGLAMGSLENTLSVKLNEKNQIELIGRYKGIYLCAGVLTLKPKPGGFISLNNVPNPATTQFVVNENGTISPKTDQSLVIGFQAP